MSELKTYIGSRVGGEPGTGRVRVEVGILNSPLVIHTQAGAAYPKSPDGHEWGYGGSGPSQLAMDILWDVYGREPHPALFQAFKRRFIEPLQLDHWRLDEATIRDWMLGQKDELKTWRAENPTRLRGSLPLV